MSKARLVKPSEHASQCAVIDWWRLSCNGFGLPEFALMAIPNGAHLAGDARGRAIKMNNLKRAGLRPGILDLFLAKPNAVANGLWIEMKRLPNKPSASQKAVILYLGQRGYTVCICYSAEQAIASIKWYLR